MKMKARFVIALLVVAAFCASAIAQENTADDWLKKGYDLMANGSYEEAAWAIQKSIDLSPSPANATLWDAKAQSLALAAGLFGNRSQYNESLKAEDKAIELEPLNTTLLIQKGFLIANMADIFENQNESIYEDAIKEFDKAIALDPRNKDAWNWKGNVLDSRLKRYDEALVAYEKAIEIGGTNASDKVLLSKAWSGKGYNLARFGRYNESAEAFDKAIELNPQNAAFIWFANATALNASGQYDGAVRAYDKAAELSEGNFTISRAYDGKGSALFKLARYDEAVSAYDKAIELYPAEQMSGATWHKKGDALEALGKASEADAAYAKAKELGYHE
jgi:tetratricopeptide (TPR) repeat protein